MNIGKVIVVEDSKIIRLSYKDALERKGFDVETFDTAKSALNRVSFGWPGIIISDVIMPGMDGISMMRRIREIDADLPVILITGQGDIPTAVQAIREGAYDFLEKPFSGEVLMEVVNRAMEKRRLVQEVRILRKEISNQQDANFRIIGKSQAVARLRETITHMSGSDPDVLILGETGTGKDLIARCLHENSPRKENNFVSINCGAIPENIIESELFGHEAGSFTGADHRRIGKFEHAHGGTVFLDEIESMPFHLQVKLLHVLQDRVIYRVGSNDPIPVDVRVVAATKTDLKKAFEENQFRKDLYYRLNVFQIYLPPLRERMEDIPLLFNHFVTEIGWRYKVSVLTLPEADFMQKLLVRPWEGNIRELKNEAEKYVLQLIMEVPGQNECFTPFPDNKISRSGEMTLNDQLTAFERTIIEQELIRQNGDIKNTYLALGIPRQTLYYKIQKYGLNRKHYQKVLENS
ncbi:MAG: sigma-54 dependent transcriptional regulator [Nitrospinota bacterium]|nr:sigma-54 dependent transcriptional regulator [Nitrospinota bacterium]